MKLSEAVALFISQWDHNWPENENWVMDWVRIFQFKGEPNGPITLQLRIEPTVDAITTWRNIKVVIDTHESPNAPEAPKETGINFREFL